MFSGLGVGPKKDNMGKVLYRGEDLLRDGLMILFRLGALLWCFAERRFLVLLCKIGECLYGVSCSGRTLNISKIGFSSPWFMLLNGGSVGAAHIVECLLSGSRCRNADSGTFHRKAWNL